MIPHDWTDLRELEISLGGGERLPGLMWVFLESSQPDGSGGGYKRPLLLERPDWVTLHLSRDDFEPQGAPAGWSSIQSIRIVGGEWGLDAVAGATLYVDRVVLHRGDEPQPTTPAAPPLVANALGHRQWAVTQPPGPDDEPAGALFVTALCVTGDDEVWVGSEEGGLAQFQGGKLRRHLTKAAGLLDSYVYALAADSQGALYIGQGRSGLLKLVAGGETALPVAGTQIGRHVYDVEIDARNAALRCSRQPTNCLLASTTATDSRAVRCWTWLWRRTAQCGQCLRVGDSHGTPQATAGAWWPGLMGLHC
jgi:hypothetical protein